MQYTIEEILNRIYKRQPGNKMPASNLDDEFNDSEEMLFEKEDRELIDQYKRELMKIMGQPPKQKQSGFSMSGSAPQTSPPKEESLVDNGIIDFNKANNDINNRLHKEKMATEAIDIDRKVDELNRYEKGVLLKTLLGVMHDLVRDGGNDLILVKHGFACEIYAKYDAVVKQIGTADETLNTMAQKRSDALAKLTDEEKKLLGIKF